MFKFLFDLRTPEKSLKTWAFIVCVLAGVVPVMTLILGVVMAAVDFGVDAIERLVWALAGGVIFSFSGIFFAHIINGFSELIAETKLLRRHFVPDQVQEEEQAPPKKSAQKKKESPQTQKSVIQRSAFEGRDDVTSFILEDGITSIGAYAFYNCTRLSSINIPNRVTSIGRAAFYNCAELVNIILPEGISTIEENTFCGCVKLQHVVIPSSVSKIDDNAFGFCKELKIVYYGGSESDWEKIQFGSYNIALTNATRYYYSETEPTDTENLYWHYVDGVPTPW